MTDSRRFDFGLDADLHPRDGDFPGASPRPVPSRVQEERRGRAAPDTLGLSARNRLLEKLDALVARGESGALLVVDIDQFHRINEDYGHSAGDGLLREVAERLRACVRRADAVAQLGGDEFAVLLGDVDSPGGAGMIARKLLDSLRDPARIDGESVAMTASIGVVLFPLHSGDTRTLMRAAYAAVREAKSRGGDQLCIHAPKVEFRTPYEEGLAFAAADLERDLRFAVRNGELELHFQPIHNLVTSRVEAVEALVRWQHPRLGLIEPDRFIPLADKIGMARVVGEHVLDVACRSLARWHAAGFRHLRVAVNLSAREFERADLAEAVGATLQRHALSPESLEVEITEHTLIEDPDAAAHADLLDRSGVQISLDDFGVKYSSLGRLHQLPVRTVKVDRSFVRDVGTSPASDSIISAVVGIARSMGLRLVAEGVEEVEQVRGLMRLGCHIMQGFLFSPPLPAAEIDRYLARVVPVTAPA